MAVSSGLRNTLSEAGSWAAAGVVLAAGLVYQEELRGHLGALIGIEQIAATQAQAPAAQTATRARVAKPETISSGGGATYEIKARGNGHFHVTAQMNGRPIEVMVDTGASLVALTYEDAERAGIFVRSTDFTHRVSTANGTAKIAPITIDRVQIGDITVRNVRGAVSEPGRLETTLLGMSFLGKLSRTEMRSGTLVLHE